ncbi:FxLYD domain-containing protein [Geobacter sp. DSM 9736]|uniref:FxLYD domain-containing protein n=1 Tax=Geobacter sp. DSM 9736 TaxID=1277350 RepID=UPI000B513261|nr:FxLYD domain-containing protein [Geobacter sp. DSM 9736]SNB45973.1 hypothetical protein SAMN06269301_1409 [Geobacter sp. DSM 9736]
MRKLHFLVVLLALFITGCSGYRSADTPGAPSPGYYTTRDLELVWRTEMTEDRLAVQGFARDKLYSDLKELSITATLLDASGKRLGTETYTSFPAKLAPNQTNPFTLSFPLRAKTERPSRIQFFVSYHIVEGKLSDTPAFHSFEADIPH